MCHACGVKQWKTRNFKKRQRGLFVCPELGPSIPQEIGRVSFEVAHVQYQFSAELAEAPFVMENEVRKLKYLLESLV